MTDPDGRTDSDLRAAGDEWRAARPAKSTRVDPMLFAVERAPRSNKALASVAGVAVIALIAVLIIVALPPRDPRIATNSPSVTTSPSPTVEATPAPSATTPVPTDSPLATPDVNIVDGIAWTRVNFDDLPTGARLSSVQILNGQFFAVAVECEPAQGSCVDGPRSFYPYVSGDGESWTPLASLTIDGLPVGFTYIDQLGYFARSTFYNGPQAGLWHSQDGTTWNWLGDSLTFDASECGSTGLHGIDIADVYAIGDGVLATGAARCENLYLIDAAWSSSDGTNWAPTQVRPAPVANVVTDGRVWVGTTDEQVMFSDDGADWTGGNQISLPSDLVRISTGFLAVSNNHNGGEDLAHNVWTSTDGRIWDVQGNQLLLHLLDTVASDGSRAVALERPNPDPGPWAVWTSSQDGKVWERHVLPALMTSGTDARFTLGRRTSATLGDRVVVVQSDYSLLTADIPTPGSPPAPTATPATPTPSGSADVGPTPSATAAPPSPPISETLDWTRTEGLFGDVMSFSNGFVRNLCDECDKQQHLQMSVDGISWSDIAQPVEGQTAQLFIADGVLMAGVVSDPTVGTMHDVSVWKWSDGDWTYVHEAPVNAGVCSNDDAPLGPFFASGDNLILIGKTEVYVPVDGWACAGVVPNIFIAAGHGMFVGAGAQTSSDLDEWFWQSDDGATWQQGQSALSNTRIVSVADGFVAIGGADGYSAPTAVFTSTDGQAWTERSYPFGEVTLRLSAFASDGNRAVLLEDSDDPLIEAPGAVWVSSPDGSLWSRYPLPPNQPDYTTSVAILGDRLVVAGSGASIDQPGGLIWTATLP